MTDLAWIDAALTSARPQALGALVRYFRDLDIAEEAFQDASLRALKSWPELRKRYGEGRVVATDVRMPADLSLRDGGPFEFVDCTDPNHITRVMQIHDVGTIYHLAAQIDERHALSGVTGHHHPFSFWPIILNSISHGTAI